MSIVKSKKIWLSSPHMGGTELDYIKEAFDTNWIAPLGPNVNGFEEDIASYLKDEVYVAALSSGTAALHLALKLVGVSSGDFVLCQSMTFAASANPIKYLGAHPIFVDSEMKTWNMCPDQLEIAIKSCMADGKKPVAIVAVHLYGMPYQVDKIHKIATTYNIPIVEDSAESLGSSYFDKACGTFGDIAILSFNGNKIITTSGGGALVAKNASVKEKAVFLATQARDDAPHYQHSEIGYNYRMSNITAGIGRGQMKVLEKHVSYRRANYDYYRKHLRQIENIEFLDEPEGFYSNRWLSCILTASFEMREEIRNALAEENIESRPLWKPMHLQPVFSGCKSFTNGVSEQIFKRGLCLPSGSNLEEDDLNRVVNIIKKVLL
ncbi:aminotransferase class I/II-fold pyridoxal phosphate-dependent enzyme [Aquimarina sp. ERC-38]|uniref:DegT/DnrJ/EryC1/StrS family aminotransferase n=1 Tax=Aquimarina sp. ERC-38 TaxID=2949996 RepID=UPI00224852B4|nr:aminotransferase class I/II-fold pyridoxal phosphate-dependent enzyme [Aquimarina sp. ERC-38]UZO80231.1 aminotransferase class I/II-fold pyridoxal phosphate-dependent enzyme [Aquimarina sp. ERC-38]